MIPSSLPSQKLSNSLIATIRLQRHLAARIIIATQEPTIDPRLLDLCSITLVHRFSSPEWMKVLKGHLAGAVAGGTTERIEEEEEEDEEETEEDEEVMKKKKKKNDQKKESEDIFNTIVDLKVGEALLFSPSAVLDVVSVVGGTTGRRYRRDGAARQQDVLAEEEEEEEEEGREESEKEEVGNRKEGGHRVRKLGTGYLKVRIRNRVTVDGGRSRCVV